MSMTPRAVRVEDELWDAAIAKAASNKDNLSAIIREALRQYLEEDAPTPQPVLAKAWQRGNRAALNRPNPYKETR